MTVREVSFDVQGDTCRGHLYLPDGSAPAPVMVLCHGIGGVQEMRMDAYAERFREAGYAVLTFDYRRFGTSDGEPRGLLVIKDERADIHAAISFVRGLHGEVDTDRVVLFGTSLGGGHAAQVAAADGKLAGVIVQAPFVNGLASSLALHPVSLIGAGLFATVDITGMILRRKPVLVPLVGTPFTPALMTAPDVVDGILKQLPEGSHLSRQMSRLYKIFAKRRLELPAGLDLGDQREKYGITRLIGSIITPKGTVIPNGIAARFAAIIPFWAPGRAWNKVTAPVSFHICSADTITPAKATRKAAASTPDAEVREYPVGHFDIYVGEQWEKVIGDQIDFLHRRVPLVDSREKVA